MLRILRTSLVLLVLWAPGAVLLLWAPGAGAARLEIPLRVPLEALREALAAQLAGPKEKPPLETTGRPKL